MAFINETVQETVNGCAGPDGSQGWYSRLSFHNGSSPEWDPTIADVHTQPTDEGGALVGRLLC